VTRLLRYVTPDAYVTSVSDVEPRELYDRGFRGAIVDLDNTIVEWHADDGPSEQVTEWFVGLKTAGFEVCLVSNNFSDRVIAFAGALDIPSVPNAGKPRGRGFRQALRLMGTAPEQTIMVGDQLFTDVLGANRLGIYSILVIPMTRKEFVGTRLVRYVERWVLNQLARRGALEFPDALGKE